MKFSKIVDLDIIEIEAPPGADAIVILHGYGADYRDLAAFGVEIPVERPIHWYFVNAPFAHEELKAFGGRMWFDIDMNGLQRALAEDRFAEFFAHQIPEHFYQVADQLERLMFKLKEQHGKLFMGGFSQGAMMAGFVSFKSPSLVSGLMLFSATFIAEDIWKKCINTPPHFPVFQSHGNSDPVLPLKEGRRLKDYLEAQGFSLEYHEFSGGHQIPIEVMERAGDFLSKYQRKL